MPEPLTPNGAKPQMNRIENHIGAYQASFQRDYASAVNLLAHPLAASAAFGAIGFGLASQAVGLWVGTLAGAADASRALLAGETGKDEGRSAGQASLRLVASAPALEPAAPETPASVALVRPAGIEKPVSPDDLKAISGIGPKLEQVLNDLGIWTYGQIVALSETEIAWLDDRLGFRGRIVRDDWLGQAKALAGKATD